MELKTEASEEVESSYRLVNYEASKLPEEYKHLIIAPFLNSLKNGNDYFKLLDRDSYYINYKLYIESLIKRTTTVIRLALLKDKTVLGWSLIEGKTVHYVWVKNEMRRQGIGRALLPKEFDTISHVTNKGINIWVNKFPHVRFDAWA